MTSISERKKIVDWNDEITVTIQELSFQSAKPQTISKRELLKTLANLPFYTELHIAIMENISKISSMQFFRKEMYLIIHLVNGKDIAARAKFKDLAFMLNKEA